LTWVEGNGALTREIKTSNFIEGYELVSALVAPSEALGHHPDLTFGWGFVRIALTTHDQGGITDLDRQLAAKFDEIMEPLLGKCHPSVTKANRP
jgi:4a-hydroxytetrahydrobiopterin dehydratase